ncbi:MAG: hypothetical protein M1502_00230 [Deltaproteobacteria bacterium]|nr:hypothetical protein [Deltaproteobacteria bacterium]
MELDRINLRDYTITPRIAFAGIKTLNNIKHKNTISDTVNLFKLTLINKINNLLKDILSFPSLVSRVRTPLPAPFKTAVNQVTRAIPKLQIENYFSA